MSAAESSPETPAAAPSPRKPRVVVVMPGRNVARTVRATFERIPPGYVDAIVLVDNKSRDDTAAIAESLGIHVIRHETNRGFGGSVKTLFTAALEQKADLILELHPDNQYPAEVIPALLAKVAEPGCGVVIGTRFLPPSRALEGGMPIWKYVANRCLSFMNNLLLGTDLAEFHSGFRVYNAEFVRQVPYQRNSDDFVFGFEILAQALVAGYHLAEVPASCDYFAEASQNNLTGSTKYGLGTLWVSLLYRLGYRFGCERRSASGGAHQPARFGAGPEAAARRPE